MQQRNDLLPQIKAMHEKYNHPYGPINLGGMQNERDQERDVINDILYLNIGDDVYLMDGTTNPGINAQRRHPEGVSHMCYGSHLKIWVIDTHAENIPSFAHEALCQRPARGCGPIWLWKDIHHNFTRADDCPTIASLDCCANWHRMSARNDVPIIGDYSDMCQVKRNIQDHLIAMELIKSVPEVATTHFIGHDGKDHWSFLFDYLLTNVEEWTL
jgi:hypothetical protein